MDIKELRIGSFIERNGVAANIEIINNEIDEVYFIGNDFYYNDFCCNIKPIPLTEEWLLKFGFEWSIHNQSYILKGFNYVIDFYENYLNKDFNLGFVKKFNINNEALISIKYVHELQNLYFILTKEELTIK